jgi:hypothetical protein
VSVCVSALILVQIQASSWFSLHRGLFRGRFGCNWLQLAAAGYMLGLGQSVLAVPDVRHHSVVYGFDERKHFSSFEVSGYQARKLARS